MNHNDTMLAAELFWVKIKGGIALLPPAVVLALSTVQVSDWVYRIFQLILLVISSIFGCYQILKIRRELNEKKKSRPPLSDPGL